MKIRAGFVSNSSSSSFIVIDRSGLCEQPYFDRNVLVVDGSLGETRFGWQWDRYSDAGSKIIFSYLQAKYAHRDDYVEMLEKVIKNHTGIRDIMWLVSDNYYEEDGKTHNTNWAYIDHQSIGDYNLEMFDNEESLRSFLFNENSFIRTGNDNEEECD